MHLVPADRADHRIIDDERVCQAIAALGDPARSGRGPRQLRPAGRPDPAHPADLHPAPPGRSASLTSPRPPASTTPRSPRPSATCAPPGRHHAARRPGHPVPAHRAPRERASRPAQGRLRSAHLVAGTPPDICHAEVVAPGTAGSARRSCGPASRAGKVAPGQVSGDGSPCAQSRGDAVRQAATARRDCPRDR